MKKLMMPLVAIVLTAAMLIGFTGCNFSVKPTNPDGGKVDADNVVGAEVNLTVGTLVRSDEQDLMQTWINAFQKKHNTESDKKISIKITEKYDGMPDIITMDNRGSLPDILWTAGDQHSNYSAAGYFQDLNNEEKFPGNKEFFSDFYEALIDSTHYSAEDEGIWFVPRDYNRIVTYINKSALDAIGVDMPSADWTWDDLVELCKQVSRYVKAPIEWHTWPPLYTTMLTNFGGAYFDNNGKNTLNSAATRECYNYINFLFNGDEDVTPKVKPYAIKGEGGLFKGYKEETMGASSPITFDVRPALPDYARTANNGRWELAVLPFPNFQQGEDKTPGFTGAGCSGYGISKACTDSKELEWAWKFLQFCMSEEGYEVVGGLGNVCPALKSLANKGSWRDYKVGNVQVDPDAFIATNTNDIFLNYYNSVKPGIHSDIQDEVAVFWSKADNSSFSAAIEHYDKIIADILKK